MKKRLNLNDEQIMQVLITDWDESDDDNDNSDSEIYDFDDLNIDQLEHGMF